VKRDKQNKEDSTKHERGVLQKYGKLQKKESNRNSRNKNFL
jgi:hypothetical protein